MKKKQILTWLQAMGRKKYRVTLLYFLFFAMFINTQGISAQGGTISGTIIDTDGIPLPGATIMAKGSNVGTTADFDGNYSISIPNSTTTLIVSYLGFVTQEIEIDGQTTINITMQPDADALDEVIVVGFGTQKKSDITGAVQRADVETFKDQANTDVLGLLQGRVAGLNIGSATTAGEEPVFDIRGTNNISGAAANQPLIVVDGLIFRGSLTDISPTDIASVDVLKDASSAAVYGSQAANGVVVITTKKGTKSGDGAPKFNFSSKTSLRQDSNPLNWGNGDDYLQLISDFDWQLSYPQGPQFDPNYDPTGGLNPPEFIGFEQGASIDWPGLVTRTGTLQQYDLSLSGATDRVNYFVSASYTDEENVIIGDDFDRITGRVNLDFKLNNWLTIGTNNFVSIGDFSGVEYRYNFAHSISPFALPFDEAGNIIPNPNGQISLSPLIVGDNLDNDQRLTLNSLLYAQLQIPGIKGLNFRVNYGNNYRSLRSDTFDFTSNDFVGQATKDAFIFNDWTLDNILSYTGTFGNHNVQGTLMYGREENRAESTETFASNFVNPVLGFNSIESAEIEQVFSSAQEESSIYNLVRLFYSYKNKYAVTLTGRRDGYSGFGENNKTAFFPSAAVAWTLSKEPFMGDTFSNLKVRASYGVVGNRGVSPYQTLASVVTSDDYVFGEGGATEIGQEFGRLPSPNLQWEETTGLNLGLDFGFLKGRIQGSFEYYNTETTNQLFSVSVPAVNGFEEQFANIGSIDNEGVELNLSSTNISRGNFQWKSMLAFSLNRNNVTSILGEDFDGDGQEDDIIDANGNRIFIGQDIGAILNYNINGIYQIGETLPNASYEPGFLKVEDINGDGVLDSEDREIIGSSLPNYRWGLTNIFTYKNLTFSFFLNSIQGGNNRFLGSQPVNTGAREKGKIETKQPVGIDYWTPDNPDAEYPSLNSRAPEAGLGIFKDRSFVRLQDVTFSYNFPTKLSQKIGLDNLALVLAGRNLATWTNWEGVDPETGVGLTAGRPILSSYTLGLNVSF
jgi:TonB-linked SusC/RagA family outer membrane protein